MKPFFSPFSRNRVQLTSLPEAEATVASRPSPQRPSLLGAQDDAAYPQTPFSRPTSPSPSASWHSEASGTHRMADTHDDAKSQQRRASRDIKLMTSELTRRLSAARLSEDLGSMPVGPQRPDLSRSSTDAQAIGDRTSAPTAKRAGAKRTADEISSPPQGTPPRVSPIKKNRNSAPQTMPGSSAESAENALFGTSAPW